MEHFTLSDFAIRTDHVSRNLPVGGSKGMEKIASKIVLDWTGVTSEQVQELAALQVKTRLQNERRVNKLPIGEGEVIKVTDLCLHQGRKGKKPLTNEDAVKVLMGNGMTLEEIIALFNKGQK
jgi:hypothetical protein